MTKEVFDEWVSVHHRDILKVAAKVVGQKAANTEVEDLVQAALARIYRTQSYLRCRISPLTWITEAVKATAKDAKRAYGRASAMMADGAVLVDHGSDSSLPTGGTPQRKRSSPRRLKVIDLAVELGVLSKDLIVALDGMGHKGMRAMSPVLEETANEVRALHRKLNLKKARTAR